MQNDKVKFKKEFKQRAYAYVLRLLRYIDSLPGDSVCKTIGKDQLLRSGTSILANYVEAQAASSRRDFINFFTYSLKSANETKMWLTLLRDLRKGSADEVSWLLQETIELANILASSILTLKNKK
jgi:four helix bundle protein